MFDLLSHSLCNTIEALIFGHDVSHIFNLQAYSFPETAQNLFF